jgi:penicillin-binding protein 1B
LKKNKISSNSTKKTKKIGSQKSQEPKSSFKIFKIIIILIFLVFGTCLGTYIYVDNLVQSRIVLRKQDVFPGIYSRPFEVYRGKKISSKILSEALRQRQYLSSTNRPKKPGEFFEQDGQFEIYLRKVESSESSSHTNAIIRYDSFSGMIEDSQNQSLDNFILEPVLISPLGTKDIKASNYQPLEKFPKHLQLLLIAAEDQRYFEHFGIDLQGILRALVTNIMAGQIVQGGSTLTQQLAKNLILSPERTLGRKFLEIFAAISLESHFTKNEILELYMNEVYLGQEGSVAIHGFSEAAQTFFLKNISDITIAESAILVGIIRAPSYYSPRTQIKRAEDRKETVLKQAFDSGFITKEKYSEALGQNIVISSSPKFKRNAPFFETFLLSEISDEINQSSLVGLGSRIYTGLDPFMQDCGQSVIQSTLSEIERERPNLKKLPAGLEAGLIALEPHSGLIRAYIGGRDYKNNQFDHVSQAIRPIGSTVKPFIYLQALDPNNNKDKLATAATIISDRPYQVSQPRQPLWQPENYDNKYEGDVSLRYALENSRNIPAAYVAMKLGIQNVAKQLENFGIADNILAVPAISLGAIDSNLIKLTSAYATIANGGILVKPRLFINIVDSVGNNLLNSSILEKRVAYEDQSFIITNILQGVIERGTGNIIRNLGYKGVAAGKTGTSNDLRDSWFIGFTTDLAVGVWVGNDKNKVTGLTGASGAARVWANFMKCIEPQLSNNEFIPPNNIRLLEIDLYSGKVVNENCSASNKIKELFISGTEPNNLCSEQVYEDSPDSESSDSTLKDKPKRRVTDSFWQRLLGY